MPAPSDAPKRASANTCRKGSRQTMDSPSNSSVATEPQAQPEGHAPQPQTPQSQSPPPPAQPQPPDSEARYQRRAAFLSSPRTKWILIFAGLAIVVAVIFLWRYLGSY